MADKTRRVPAPSRIQLDEAITVVSDNTIQINPNKLGPPPALYDADYAWFRERLGGVSLFFGKEDLNKAGHLRTRLEVRFAPAPFLGHFWKNSRGFHERLRKYVEQHPADPARAELGPEKWEAAKDHSEWVNLDYLAHTGDEASLDFYNLSIRGVAAFLTKQGTSGLEVTPIVRVQTTAQELCCLMDSCETIIPSLRNRHPEVEDKDEDAAS